MFSLLCSVSGHTFRDPSRVLPSPRKERKSMTRSTGHQINLSSWIVTLTPSIPFRRFHYLRTLLFRSHYLDRSTQGVSLHVKVSWLRPGRWFSCLFDWVGPFWALDRSMSTVRGAPPYPISEHNPQVCYPSSLSQKYGTRRKTRWSATQKAMLQGYAYSFMLLPSHEKAWGR